MVLFSLGVGPTYACLLPSVNTLRKEFDENKKTLSIIKLIKEGDKLSKCRSSGDYYIDEAGYTQKFRRMWYGQNRSQTFSDLDADFSLFMKYLDNVTSAVKQSRDNTYSQLLKESGEFINAIVPGLYNLKKTYPDYDKIRCKIDSIILALIDFKDSAAKCEALKESIRARARAFSFDN